MANKQQRIFDFYPLEDRVLLSGEGLDGADLSVDADLDLTASLLAEVTADGQATEDPAVAAALVAPAAGNDEQDSNDLADAPTFDPALPLEVVFVDAGVEDAQTLLDGLRGDGDQQTQWLVVELSANEDGVEQITRSLSQLSGVDAIHILSHGDDEGIQLGNARLDVDTAAGYAGEISSWADSLDSDADILIYGCDLASSEDGRALIESIGALTDADVAASDDATGNESLGGDWELEYATGVIETGIAFDVGAQQSWEYILATYTVTNTNDSGADSLRQAILDANGNAGADTIEFNIALTDAGHVYYQDDGIDGSLSVIATTTLPDGSITDFDPDYPAAGYSWYTIDVQSALPTITDEVFIDGTSQPGAIAGKPIIELDGSHDGSNIAAGRRVQLPWGANNLDVTTLTSEGQTIMRRSLEWASGLGTPGNVLLVVDDAITLNAQDLAKKSMMEGWGFTVNVIDSADSQAAFDAAVAVNDVAFISEDIVAGDLGSKLREAPIGVVAEEANLIDTEFGTASSIAWDSAQTAINIDDNSHYITSTLSTGSVTVFTTAESMAYIDGTAAPDLAQLGSSPLGTALFAIDAGQELVNGTGFTGLHITGDNSTIKGLVVNRFQKGIDVDSGDGNVIQGNYIGTDVTGTLDLGNTGNGIEASNSATNTQIGGNTAAARNLISGNNADGISIWGFGGSGNIVQGNYIGTDVTGTLDLGNDDHGIAISGWTADNVIGGVNPNEGNTIAFNKTSGIGVWDAPTIDNSILGNSIFRNDGLGIDINNDGVTPNDAGDTDAGANDVQNTPVFTTVSHSLGSTTVNFDLNTNQVGNYRIEFFVSDVADGSGQTLVHSEVINHVGGGNRSFVSAAFATSANAIITATATEDLGASYGSTSEFSQARTAQGNYVLVVDTTSDVRDGTTTSITNLIYNRGADGKISLREAIEAANNDTATDDLIQFEILDALVGGVHTINVGSWIGTGLDLITDTVIIDATTDSDFAGNPVIEINGVSSGAQTAFRCLEAQVMAAPSAASLSMNSTKASLLSIPTTTLSSATGSALIPQGQPVRAIRVLAYRSRMPPETRSVVQRLPIATSSPEIPSLALRFGEPFPPRRFKATISV